MRLLLTLAAAAALAAAIAAAAPAVMPPDAPPADYARTPGTRPIPPTYAAALASWATPEDIAHFAGAKFVYDRARALALAEPAAAADARPPIRTPHELYAEPSGVCIDLARFAVETLNRIDRAYDARYLMIEFEPVVVDGRTLRRHWIAAFRRDGAFWFFADSARPGAIDGPYASVEAFVEAYAELRHRPIVAWRLTDTYARKLRSMKQRG